MKKAVFELWGELMAEPENPDPTRGELLWAAYGFMSEGKEYLAFAEIEDNLNKWIVEFKSS